MTTGREQLGFLGAFSPANFGKNDRLDRIGAVAKWYRFEKLLKVLRPDGPGRPPYDPLVMFKALLLAYLYDLSDADLEQELNDRVSFARFIGLTLDMRRPDHTTICRFRNRLIEAGLLDKLFSEFHHQLERGGFILKRGTMIDATLIQAAAACPPPGDQGGDPDARIAKK